MKVKMIIFDLDGVLIDAKPLHYDALNRALGSIDESYIITKEEHLSIYDGRPTRVKLKMLTENKGLPENLYDEVWRRKQKFTIDIANEQFKYDNKLIDLLSHLKEEYTICVCSNSIRETTKVFLLNTGLLRYIDFFISNQDVKNPKPNSEMFLKAMIKAEVDPNEVLIIEDSPIGRKAAYASGAHVLEISNLDEVNLSNISKKLISINKVVTQKPKWRNSEMNVLIPMAGAGSRFEKAGFTFPKPLIEVHNKPMIQLVVENLNIDAKHIFIVQKAHYEKYHLKALLNLIAPNCEIVQVENVTEGAACTTLLAKEFINNDKPLLTANSDQFIKWDSNNFLYAMTSPEVDGGILTFKGTHPKWSFAKLGTNGFVERVAEKEPISDLATVGIYYWSKGSDYVKYAEQMIEKDIRTNGEFYVCPVYNEAIQDGKNIKTFNVEEMWGLGTPEDLTKFIENYKE